MSKSARECRNCVQREWRVRSLLREQRRESAGSSEMPQERSNCLRREWRIVQQVITRAQPSFGNDALQLFPKSTGPSEMPQERNNCLCWEWRTIVFREAFSIHPFVSSSIHGWHHTGKKTLTEINNPPPLCMCRCLGKACPAPRGAPPRFWYQCRHQFLVRVAFGVYLSSPVFYHG